MVLSITQSLAMQGDESPLDKLPSDTQEEINSYLGIRGKSNPGKSEILRQKVEKEKFEKRFSSGITFEAPEFDYFKSLMDRAEKIHFIVKNITIKGFTNETSRLNPMFNKFIDYLSKYPNEVANIELDYFLNSDYVSTLDPDLTKKIASVLDNKNIKKIFMNIKGPGNTYEFYISEDLQKELKEKYGDRIEFGPMRTYE